MKLGLKLTPWIISVIYAMKIDKRAPTHSMGMTYALSLYLKMGLTIKDKLFKNLLNWTQNIEPNKQLNQSQEFVESSGLLLRVKRQNYHIQILLTSYEGLI